MESPIRPMAAKTFYYARRLRYLFFFLFMAPIFYLFYSFDSWVGLILAVISSFLWLLEIRRGNHGEDYLIENYENPLT